MELLGWIGLIIGGLIWAYFACREDFNDLIKMINEDRH